MAIAKESLVLINLYNLQARLTKQLDQSLMVHGISTTEFVVMHQLSLSATENMRRIDLADKTGLSASGVTRLLNPMQKIGLVQKEESARDARVSLVKLTKVGKKILADAEKTFDASASMFLDSLSEKQRVVFGDTVESLL